MQKGKESKARAIPPQNSPTIANSKLKLVINLAEIGQEDGSQGLVPSFADIVAGRPPRQEQWAVPATLGVL